MIQIEPIEVGFPQKEQATQIVIRPIINSTADVSCNTYWELQTESGKMLANGNILIPEEDYKLGAITNLEIEDYVIEKLELKKIVAPTTKENDND